MTFAPCSRRIVPAEWANEPTPRISTEGAFLARFEIRIIESCEPTIATTRSSARHRGVNFVRDLSGHGELLRRTDDTKDSAHAGARFGELVRRELAVLARTEPAGNFEGDRIAAALERRIERGVEGSGARRGLVFTDCLR